MLRKVNQDLWVNTDQITHLSLDNDGTVVINLTSGVSIPTTMTNMRNVAYNFAPSSGVLET